MEYTSIIISMDTVFQIEQKKEVIDETKGRLKERKTHLKHKRVELDAILSETQKEEEALKGKSLDFQKKLDERLVKAYMRIRNNVKNGLSAGDEVSILEFLNT